MKSSKLQEYESELVFDQLMAWYFKLYHAIGYLKLFGRQYYVDIPACICSIAYIYICVYIYIYIISLPLVPVDWWTDVSFPAFNYKVICACKSLISFAFKGPQATTVIHHDLLRLVTFVIRRHQIVSLETEIPLSVVASEVVRSVLLWIHMISYACECFSSILCVTRP